MSIEHYMEGRYNKKTKQAENKKQIFSKRLYWVVFQFFIQKNYAWQNNTFWCGIISTKNTIRFTLSEVLSNYGLRGKMESSLWKISICSKRFWKVVRPFFNRDGSAFSNEIILLEIDKIIWWFVKEIQTYLYDEKTFRHDKKWINIWGQV